MLLKNKTKGKRCFISKYKNMLYTKTYVNIVWIFLIETTYQNLFHFYFQWKKIKQTSNALGSIYHDFTKACRPKLSACTMWKSDK